MGKLCLDHFSDLRLRNVVTLSKTLQDID